MMKVTAKEHNNLIKYANIIENEMLSKIENIPENIKEVVFNQSLNDTKLLFSNGDNIDFKKINYTIYRAYILGILLCMDKTDNDCFEGIS